MDLSVFKDPELAKGLIHSIQKWAPQQATLMEVCGTHTVSIARNGLRSMMPEGTRLASGPGCPVCVTHSAFPSSRRKNYYFWRHDPRSGFYFELT